MLTFLEIIRPMLPIAISRIPFPAERPLKFHTFSAFLSLKDRVKSMTLLFLLQRHPVGYRLQYLFLYVRLPDSRHREFVILDREWSGKTATVEILKRLERLYESWAVELACFVRPFQAFHKDQAGHETLHVGIVPVSYLRIFLRCVCLDLLDHGHIVVPPVHVWIDGHIAFRQGTEIIHHHL